jgi:hypothetical protein
MIGQVGQGRMLAGLEQAVCMLRRLAVVLMIVAMPMWEAAETRYQAAPAAERRTAQAPRRSLEQMQRQEGEAILALADAAVAGKPVPSDFAVQWQNDFVKAQRGTFVPFTLTVDASQLNRPSALVYVRATRRSPGSVERSGGRTRKERPEDAAGEGSYPVDAIFPVELERFAGVASRVSRGFSVLPGDYEIFVVMREREDPGAPRSQPKASVVRQSISVPDFWSNELTTSSMILADRLSTLPEPVAADQISERPYAIGRNEITPAFDRRFRKDEELIVVFLVYNPMVTAERHFDVKVEYHFFRKLGGVQVAATRETSSALTHPPERAGEQYFNHTDPQRFNPALMGTSFNPGAGEPVMAGQVVPLAGFQEGEYRLAVQIVDLLSGESISRDVFFTVGS